MKQHAVKLTPKGDRTRTRILNAAARLIYAHGVAGTTLEDVRVAAEVSGSQLSHYFADKDALVREVIDHQANAIVGNQERADFSTVEGLRAWRERLLAEAGKTDAKGGCPLGSLGSQVAERDARARIHVAAGFGRWSDVLVQGLRALQAGGKLASDIDPDDLAVTLLAAVQGGLLLAQVQRDTRPLRTALDTILLLATAPGACPRGASAGTGSQS